MFRHAARNVQPVSTLTYHPPSIEGESVWSIVCFYLAREIRGQDLSMECIESAVEYARSQGAKAVEGYPVEPEIEAGGAWRPARCYRCMGYRTAFLKAGFQDLTPEDSKRKIVRYPID